MNIHIAPDKFAIELGFESGDYLDVVAKSQIVAYEPDKEFSAWRIIQAPSGKWVSWKSESKKPVYDAAYHFRREDALSVLRQEFDLLSLSEYYWMCRELRRESNEQPTNHQDDSEW